MQDISHLIWKILVEYIPAKDRQSAAFHLVNELVDSGIEEDDLFAISKGNAPLRTAINEVVGEEEFDEFDDDYEE